MSSIGNQRRSTIRAIKRMVEPHFRDSGYMTVIDPTKSRFAEGNRRPVKLWAAEDQKPIRLRGAFLLTEFSAITEFGPMVDASGGGMVWQNYNDFTIEDLLKLHAWAGRTFALPTTSPNHDPSHTRLVSAQS